jgi:hypothetical protein
MPMRRARARAAIVAGVFVAGAALAAPPSTDLKIDACALLDAASIQKVLGVPVEQGTRRDSGIESNGAYSSACVWVLSGDSGKPPDPKAPLGGRRFVILNALRYPNGSEGAKTYLEEFRKASESGVIANAPSARSFGDEALWWGDGLAVRLRDVSFGISVFVPRPATGEPGEREGQLARTVLARLAEQNKTR